MGIFDIFDNTPQPSAQPAPALASPSADYGTFLQRLISARVAQSRANPTNVLSWVNGDATKAAEASANADAPALWDAYKAAQAGSQGAQLTNAQNYAMQGAMANTDIDPNNPMASKQAMQAAMTVPAASGANSSDPVARQRAQYNWLGTMLSRNPATVAVAKEFFALRDKGIPEGTIVLPDGTVHDATSGKLINSNVGDVKAWQAEPTKRMETGLDIAKANHQAGLDVGVHAANANKDASLDLVDGIDLKTGLPVTRTRADVVANGGQVKSNPYFEGQQAEIKPLREGAESAEQGLTLAQQLVGAANGLFTGKGASTLQDVRKLALAAGELTGAKPSDAVLNDASKFEQLKFASQQLVAKASHDLSPRIAQNIYAQINAVKPGDATSIQGLRDIIIKQIVPALSRAKAIYKGTSRYYQQNPFKNDAQTVVPGQNPVENFSVKDVGSAEPGDFYIDPHSGNLRQRPLN
jgi:hypothetical protein